MDTDYFSNQQDVDWLNEILNPSESDSSYYPHEVESSSPLQSNNDPLSSSPFHETSSPMNQSPQTSSPPQMHYEENCTNDMIQNNNINFLNQTMVPPVTISPFATSNIVPPVPFSTENTNFFENNPSPFEMQNNNNINNNNTAPAQNSNPTPTQRQTRATTQKKTKQETQKRGRKKKTNNFEDDEEEESSINVVQKHLTKTKKVRKNDKNTFQICLDSENEFRELPNDQLIHLSGEQIELYVNRLRSKRKITETEEKELKEVRKSIKNREYAQNSRQKERELKQFLQNQVEQLKKENQDLLQRNTQLEIENKTVNSQIEQVKAAVKRDSSILDSIQNALGVTVPWLTQTSTQINFSATSCSASSLEGQGGRVNTKFAKRGTTIITSLFIILFTFGFAFNVNPMSLSKQAPFDKDHCAENNWNTARVLMHTPDSESWFSDHLNWLTPSYWSSHDVSSYCDFSTEVTPSSLPEEISSPSSSQTNPAFDSLNSTQDTN